ncbi:MAG: alpha/beta hydrolase [Pseudomonadales bacterium]|nr:alpha/beta hydrolase [Pseudomonadales bacterium]
MTAAMKASPSLTNAMGIASIPLDELKKKYTDERSQFIEINGLNIHYRIEGEGEPVVLVHGIVSSLQTWDDWATELRKSYKVISLDVPGYGLTGGPENEDDFNEDFLINTFAKFIDALELDRINLAGNSLGGYISAQYASQYPNRVKKLILLDPVAYPQKTPWVMDFATLPGIKQMGKLVAPPLLVTANVEDTYGDPERIQEKHMARYVHMSQRPGAKTAYIKTFEMLKARSTQEVPMPFHSITAPTLLMWGGRDAWVPVELSQRWQEDIAHALLKVYPTAGHMPMEEIPDITVKDAMAFLNGDSIETTDYAAFASSKAADHLN